jgi:hypothetical protein
MIKRPRVLRQVIQPDDRDLAMRSKISQSRRAFLTSVGVTILPLALGCLEDNNPYAGLGFRERREKQQAESEAKRKLEAEKKGAKKSKKSR